jgi:hypothetical protein
MINHLIAFLSVIKSVTYYKHAWKLQCAYPCSSPFDLIFWNIFLDYFTYLFYYHIIVVLGIHCDIYKSSYNTS